MTPTPALPGQADPMRIFDRALLRRRRDRAASGGAPVGFLHELVAERLVERLDEVRRQFDSALDLGCHGGAVGRLLHGRVARLVQCDLSSRMAEAARARSGHPEHATVVADEEALPFAAGTFDLVLSGLALHWVNDLPGTLLQIRRVLRPDGLLLAALPCAGTLEELRQVLLEAEAAATGGASPRISPFIDLRDGGALLQRAGFALPMADADTLTVTYPDALALMRDLRAMGETNAVLARRTTAGRRDVLLGAAARYAARHAGPDGRIPATFRIVTLTAWAPHPSQPRPLRPGSATHRLGRALGAEEHPAGDPAGRSGDRPDTAP